MFCFGSKSKTNSKKNSNNAASAPQGIMRPEHKARNGIQDGQDNESSNVSAAPVDLRAEQDEPMDNSVKLMDYLLTQVATK